jgi:hypothetical protein
MSEWLRGNRTLTLMMVSATMGWVAAGYIYQRLSPGFIQRKPVAAFLIVGVIVAAVVSLFALLLIWVIK